MIADIRHWTLPPIAIRIKVQMSTKKKINTIVYNLAIKKQPVNSDLKCNNLDLNRSLIVWFWPRPDYEKKPLNTQESKTANQTKKPKKQHRSRKRWTQPVLPDFCARDWLEDDTHPFQLENVLCLKRFLLVFFVFVLLLWLFEMIQKKPLSLIRSAKQNWKRSYL